MIDVGAASQSVGDISNPGPADFKSGPSVYTYIYIYIHGSSRCTSLTTDSYSQRRPICCGLEPFMRVPEPMGQRNLRNLATGAPAQRWFMDERLCGMNKSGVRSIPVVFIPMP